MQPVAQGRSTVARPHGVDVQLDVSFNLGGWHHGTISDPFIQVHSWFTRFEGHNDILVVFLHAFQGGGVKRLGQRWGLVRLRLSGLHQPTGDVLSNVVDDEKAIRDQRDNAPPAGNEAD